MAGDNIPLEPMTINSLLLCRDSEVVHALRRVLNELGIHVLVSTSCAEATEIISRRKFARSSSTANHAGCSRVAEMPAAGALEQAAIAFAIINGSTSVRGAFDLGANFVLDKPVSYENALRSFRAAHGLIVRERRRYYRHEIELPVSLDVDGDLYRATTVDLSEGGIAVRCDKSFPAPARFA